MVVSLIKYRLINIRTGVDSSVCQIKLNKFDGYVVKIRLNFWFYWMWCRNRWKQEKM